MASLRAPISAVLGVVALVSCASNKTEAGTSIRALSSLAPVTTVEPAIASVYPVPEHCKADSVRIALGSPPTSETGEHAFVLAITSIGPAGCWISGYPRIRLLDADGVELPMTYRDGGGHVTTAAPTPVLLRPRRGGTVVVAKYRCDLGDVQVATTIEVAPPGSAEFTSIPTAAGSATVDYCGPNDPGDNVDISPIASDMQTAVGQFLAPGSSPAPPANS